MFTSYDKTAEEAIEMVLNSDERATCATVKVSNPEGNFSVEYLNHPDDEDCAYNVTTDSLPDGLDGFTIEDSGPGFTEVKTMTDKVDEVHEDILRLAGAASPNAEFTIEGAATKRVPAKSWEPTFREAVIGLYRYLNPFTESPRG